MNTVKENPFIGHADREYEKWLKEHPPESWVDDIEPSSMYLRFSIDEEVLIKIYSKANEL